MTALGPPVPPVGVFRHHLVHLVDPGAYVIDFRGTTLYFGRYGAVRVPIVGPSRVRRTWCRACIDQRAG